MLAMAGRTFGQSPARTYLGLVDPILVSAIDEALAVRLLLELSGAPAGLPEPMKLATEFDYDDAMDVAELAALAAKAA